MLIAAAVVGLITAYFFGLKPGAYAAAIAFGIFALALMVPSLAPFIYAGTAAGLIGVYVVGSRKPHHKRNAKMLRRFRAVIEKTFKR